MKKLIKLLGGWEGYRVAGAEVVTSAKGAPTELQLELKPMSSKGLCGECGAMCRHVHETEMRWIRELPVLGCPTRLLVHRRRMWCEACGKPKLEQLSWLGMWERYTKRFGETVASSCKKMTHKAVAEMFGINRKTVKAIDKRHLEENLGPPCLDGVTELAIDEFAIQTGHRYATIIVEPHRKEILWVGRGRGREDIRPFFEMLGEEGCQRIRAVAMDMNGAFQAEVQAQCPNTCIVYDQFHVVAKYAREVITKVRAQEAKRVQRDSPEYQVLKGSTWLLLRNKKKLGRKARIRLKELLNANKRIALVYMLKEDLKQLWKYKNPKAATRFFDQWYHRAIHSRIEPLKKFARNLKSYFHGIVSHCQYPLHTSLLEGMNNKIKVIKRMAYGYRDDEYFFLKIRQAFPGNGT